MRQIFAASDLRDTDLAGLYEYPPGPWLRANMVSSADGAALPRRRHLRPVLAG